MSLTITISSYFSWKMAPLTISWMSDVVAAGQKPQRLLGSARGVRYQPFAVWILTQFHAESSACARRSRPRRLLAASLLLCLLSFHVCLLNYGLERPGICGRRSTRRGGTRRLKDVVARFVDPDLFDCGGQIGKRRFQASRRRFAMTSARFSVVGTSEASSGTSTFRFLWSNASRITRRTNPVQSH